jgi:hypothetical protein
MARDLRPGESVYLVPTLPTAPSAAYRRPPCEVGEVYGERCIVILGDGSAVDTFAANVVRELPADDPAPRRLRPVRPLDLPEGCEEVTLW